jgi:hypothetical protein
MDQELEGYPEVDGSFPKHVQLYPPNLSPGPILEI